MMTLAACSLHDAITDPAKGAKFDIQVNRCSSSEFGGLWHLSERWFVR